MKLLTGTRSREISITAKIAAKVTTEAAHFVVKIPFADIIVLFFHRGQSAEDTQPPFVGLRVASTPSLDTE